jgi:hypothetical protein
MKVIIYKNDSGNVSVCYPTGELPIETLKDRLLPIESIIVDHDILPNADDDFFDAWELDGETVSVNFTKSQAITKDRLRAERVPLLAAQDVAFMRATETADGVTLAAVAAEKQRLRDITNLVDACTTLDELRGLSCH